MLRTPTALGMLLLMASPAYAALHSPEVAAAIALAHAHKLKAAEHVLDTILDRDPTQLDANLQMGMLKDYAYEDQAGLTYFKRAASEHPESLEAQVMLVHAYIWTDRIRDAQRQADKTFAEWGNKDPDKALWAKLLIGLGGVQGIRAQREGLWAALKYGLAVRGTMEHAYALDPGGVMPLYALGRYYLEAPGMAGGNANKGLEYLSRAVAKDPQNHKYRLDYLRYLRKTGHAHQFQRELASYQADFADCPPAMTALQPLLDK